MADNGYIKLYRNLLDNPIMRKPDYLTVWIYLLLKANHKENSFIFNNKAEILKAGQLITGRKKLAQITGISESQVYKILNYLEIEQQIEQQKNNKYTLITILNWHKFQENGTTKEQEKEQPSNNHGTTTEQPSNTNKNDKNDKNNIYIAPDVSNETSDTAPCNTNNSNPNKKKSKKYRITFDRDKWEFIGITEEDIDLWAEAYPAVDLDAEVKRAKVWIKKAGARGYKSDWFKFLSGWFERAQERGGTK